MCLKSSQMTVTIKLKPYLIDFVVSQFGEQLSSRKNFFGLLLQKFVTYRPANAPVKYPSGPGYLEITLINSADYQVRNGNAWISPKNQTDLERLLNEHFKTVFYQYMDDRVRWVRQQKEGTIKDCIIQFCTDYGLNFNHIDFGTLKKAYYRHELKKSARLEKARKSGNDMSSNRPFIFNHREYEPLHTAKY